MKISINNGRTFMHAVDITDIDLEYHWLAIVEAMELRAATEAHEAVAPCSQREFLAAYLERATTNLIVG